MLTLYGVPGWGSAISEVMLTMAEIPYHFVDVNGFDNPGPQHDVLEQINPLCQVPTLRLDDGSVMTESAAIALMILDTHPHLAPPIGTPQRALFQRLLVWLVANVYPTFTYADYPERFASDAPEQLKNSCIAYRKTLYQWLDQQLVGPYALGDNVTLLDAYIVVIRTWGPRPAWFTENTPRLSAIADHIAQREELQTVLRSNDLLTAQNAN
ncbi:glutathione S-transferase family protein [Scandinavium sp. V105_16]|uniref:Glutathione S-transferase family protein n=1 Tax=Scandinavium lactucae TaxID=3095028 RepID=A0AAJ2S9U3_9ENTR|nr:MULTISPECIES: glutathione S-transferase family protein [unclassified Scandinavium]MDX6022313.1 glutathione S-transferase family protein [Scandinavium sp. V105_16]MDX6033845.1 glutathione S-transferase family protein [Scandinavium sp. V105_12]